ncbi:MAG: hypothetical protein F6J98_01975 [Moorea sp. SIO4G2]|nr:hypothetical protein [Moorena sp. SIO4G2]
MINFLKKTFESLKNAASTVCLEIGFFQRNLNTSAVNKEMVFLLKNLVKDLFFGGTAGTATTAIAAFLFLNITITILNPALVMGHAVIYALTKSYIRQILHIYNG